MLAQRSNWVRKLSHVGSREKRPWRRRQLCRPGGERPVPHCPPRVFVDHPVWPRVTCSRNALEVGCGERGLVEGGLVEGA